MLEGKRVVLQAIQREDIDRLWELFEDLEFAARISNDPPVPWARARMEAEFERSVTASDQVNFGIESDGELIGRCGLYNVDHFGGRAELGIGLGRAYWGRGYGQDAVRTLVDYGFRHLNLQRISLEALADDARAVGAYQKVGFVEEGRLRKHAWFDGEYVDAIVMGLLRSEWPEKAH